MRLVLTAIMIFLASAPALAQEPVDYLALALKLLRDGYTERAGPALEKVDPDAAYFNAASFYTAKGIYLHRQNYPVLSNIYLQAAVDRGQDNESLYLYMARNYWKKADYAKVITYLDLAGEEGKSAAMLAVRADALKKLGDLEQAWQVLDDAIVRYPQETRFYRQKFNYLIEAGLFLQAMTYAEQYLQGEQYTAEEYMAIAYALRETGQHKLASELLEEGLIRHADTRKLAEMLAQLYIDQQQFFSAALVLDWASLRMPGLAYKAAALYVKADSPVRALQLNRRVVDQSDKFRQRLGIDIAIGDYESLVAKEGELIRLGLLEDDNIKYALGYGHFITGDHQRARHWLKLIRQEAVFLKAIQLLNQIEECGSDPAGCI